MTAIKKMSEAVSTRRALSVVGAVGVLLLVPALAWAIPGSGELTSLDSPSGREIADLYNMLAKICFVIFVIVCTILLGAIVKFKRRDDDENPEQIHGHLRLEIGLMFAALAIQVYIGVKTIDTMWYVEKLPETQMTVEAIGYQWDWQFRYPDHGGFLAEDLVIPAHTNIKLDITSKDVIHSLFVPELGVKMDAVPGRFNYWWVNADGPVNQIAMSTEARVEQAPQSLSTTRSDNPLLLNSLNAFSLVEPEERAPTTRGLERRVDYLAASRKIDDKYAKYDAVEYRGMCTELCGKGHYDMYFRVVAMTPSSFERWIEDQKNGGGKEADGEQIYQSKCASCHGAEGLGVGSQFPPLSGSEWVNSDEEENKRTHINVVLNGLEGQIEVKGVSYNGVMQPWAEALNDEEVAAVVNHERSSWGNNGGLVDAKMVAEQRERSELAPYPAGGSKPVPDRDLMNEGEKIYAACVTCHGAEGNKGKARIARSPMANGDINGYVSMLVNGTEKKSAMGRSMSNRDLAAIITYTRGSFGNEASAVQPDEVGRIRGEVTKPLP